MHVYVGLVYYCCHSAAAAAPAAAAAALAAAAMNTAEHVQKKEMLSGLMLMVPKMPIYPDIPSTRSALEKRVVCCSIRVCTSAAGCRFFK